MIQSSRPRPPHDDPLEKERQASALSGGEERALDAIRRQLDIDFPLGAEEPTPARVFPRRARPARTPPAAAAARPAQIWTALGVLFLVACAVVGGAGIRLAVQYGRTVESRAAADRGAAALGSRSADALHRGVSPGREVATPRETTRAPAAVDRREAVGLPPAIPPAPAPEIVLPPRRLTPGRTSDARVEAPARPASPPTADQVPGRPAAFDREGRYFKHLDGVWLVGERADGPWSAVTVDQVPPSILALPDVADGAPVQYGSGGAVTSP